jgi:shikimate kinase
VIDSVHASSSKHAEGFFGSLEKPLPQASRKNIVLTGFMAVGKSVVGRELAHRLKRNFVDLDLAIESREGLRVSEIFSVKGEPYFRKVEKELLRECLKGEAKVIAIGGGAIIDEENLRLLKQTSVLIALKAKPETILGRASAGGSRRPLLQGADKLATIEKLLAHRERLYGQAHFSIGTDRLSVKEVVEEIIKLIPSAEN